MEKQIYTLEELCVAMKFQRVRPLYGIKDEDQAWIRKVWSTLSQIETIEDLPRWSASIRLSLFGNAKKWPQSSYEIDPTLALEGHRRGRLLLGPAVMKWILNDEWVDNAEELMKFSLTATKNTWTSEDLILVNQKSQQLAEKFGFLHLRVNAGESVQATLELLSKADKGLSEFANVIDFSEKELGSNRIGLSWGLTHDFNAGAHFDPLTSSVNLQEEGSFAHEWSHALDLTLGALWDNRSTGKQKYASHQAHEYQNTRCRWDNEPESGSLEEMQLSIARRDELSQSSLLAIQVTQDALEQLSQVLSIVSEDIPYPQWQERATQRINAYRKWLSFATSPEPNLEIVQSQWERWKRSCEVAWSDPDEPLGNQFRHRWFRMIRVAERISFGSWPKHKTWVSWAIAKDEEDDNAYWAEPHELWARSFHAMVYATLGRSSWAASMASDPDQFPQGQEQKEVLNWWLKWLPEWKKTWTLSLMKENDLEKMMIPVLEKSNEDDDGAIACWKNFKRVNRG